MGIALKKLKFLQKESLSRCGVAFLLACGLLLPMLMAMGLRALLFNALLISAVGILVFTALSISRKSQFVLWGILLFLAILQLFLPRFGLFGSWWEGLKAIALYFAGNQVVLPLYGTQAVTLFAVLVACSAFWYPSAAQGFYPWRFGVLVLFGLWSLGKAAYLWYVAPALVAILLQMSTEAHERINLLHVLPMALAVVLLSLVILPAGKMTVGLMEKAASDLKQKITDYFFFTEARNVFTIGSYGYYPMGNGQLGGEAEPSEYPVMTVKTDQKTLMRAVIKDEYTAVVFAILPARNGIFTSVHGGNHSD